MTMAGTYTDIFGDGPNIPVDMTAVSLNKHREMVPKCKNRSARFLRFDELPRYFQKYSYSLRNIATGGIVVYNDGDTIYVDASSNHTLIVGPTGTWKTTGEIEPAIVTMGFAREHLIINDVKGELSHKYVNFFKNNGYDVVVINLIDPLCGDHYNPMTIPQKDAKEGHIGRSRRELRKYGKSIVSDNEKDKYWPNTAAETYSGAASLLIEYLDPNKEITIDDVCKLITENTWSADDRQEFLSNLRARGVDIGLIRAIMPLLDNAESTSRCIRSCFDEAMEKFSEPDKIDMMSTSDFDIDNLAGDKPMAIFCIVPGDDEGANMIYAAFLQQVYNRMTGICTEKGWHSLRKRINLVIDEAGTVKIDGLAEKMALSRGYNIRITLAVQSIDQLKMYGDKYTSIIENSKNLVYLGGYNPELMDSIIERAGKRKDGTPLLTRWNLDNLERGKEALYIIDGKDGVRHPFVGRITPMYMCNIDKDWEEYMPRRRSEPALGKKEEPSPERSIPQGAAALDDIRSVFDDEDDDRDTNDAPYFVGPGTSYLERCRILEGLLRRTKDRRAKNRILEHYEMTDCLILCDYFEHLSDIIPFDDFHKALIKACESDDIDPLMMVQGCEKSLEAMQVAKTLIDRMAYLVREVE